MVQLAGEDDLRDVRSAVADVVGSWKDLGISLGIQWSKLDAIKSTSPSECLTEMLALWLKQNYNVRTILIPSYGFSFITPTRLVCDSKGQGWRNLPCQH